MNAQPAKPGIPTKPPSAVTDPRSAAEEIRARDEMRKILLPARRGWLRCFEGFVNGGQVLAFLIGRSASDDESYVVRLRLLSGDIMTLRLGPYEDRDFAELVALTVLGSLP